MQSQSITLKELFEDEAILSFDGDWLQRVSHLAMDSRRVEPGSVFFALPGQRTDGNAHIPTARRRGALAIVSEIDLSKHKALGTSLTKIQVKGIRSLMARVASRFYAHAHQSLTLTGITGTNGKTTVAFLSRYLLARSQRKVGLVGTIQYALGSYTLPAHRTTPEAIDLHDMFAEMKASDCAEVVMEVSSHAIDQQRVHGLNFDIAVFLNLTQDHLDYHKSLDHYFAVKAGLFTGQVGSPPPVSILSMDDDYGRLLKKKIPRETRVFTFGIDKPEADFAAHDLQLTETGSIFSLDSPVGRFVVKIPLLGHYSVSNALAALAIAYSRGCDLSESIEHLAAFPGVPGRMERIDEGQAFSVLVDYAHTEDALSNALKMLRVITAKNLFIVFGCGGNRDRSKRPLMMKAALAGADKVWATADNPRDEILEQIFDDMRMALKPGDEKRVAFIYDRRRAIHLALKAAQPGDCVLIAGKGHEPYQESKGKVLPFDDRIVTRQILMCFEKYRCPQI